DDDRNGAEADAPRRVPGAVCRGADLTHVRDVRHSRQVEQHVGARRAVGVELELVEVREDFRKRRVSLAARQNALALRVDPIGHRHGKGSSRPMPVAPGDLYFAPYSVLTFAISASAPGLWAARLTMMSIGETALPKKALLKSSVTLMTEPPTSTPP